MRLISLLLISTVLFFSCRKDKVQIEEDGFNLMDGALVLNEGLFQQNNASISWVSFTNSAVSDQFFLEKTDRALGDTGNDIEKYGGKIYIVVNVSSTIEIMDASTFTSIKQIEMVAGGISKQPRSIAFYGEKAYVTCYDGYVDVIDTTSLIVEQRIAVGLNPEGITICNDKIYVANSGGLNFPLMDSTISIIDPITNVELQKIVVGLNPGELISDDQGEVYVISRGNYGSIQSDLYRIDAYADTLIGSLGIELSSICKMENNFLIAYQNPSGGGKSIGLFNAVTENMINSNYINTASITTLYGVYYNSFDQQIYVTDAMNYTNTGYVHVFSSNGISVTDYHVGLNPSKIIFYE